MRRHRSHAGMSLIELLVALAVGSAMIAGAVYAYSEGRRLYTVNEALARVQEQARYAMSVIQPDAELAGFLGFTNSSDTIRWLQGAAPNVVLASAAALRQRPLPPLPAVPVPAPGLPASAHACGTNFAVDVNLPVQGSNNEFRLGEDATAACGPYGTGAVAGSDTLTVRRASSEPTDPEAGRIQVYASRLTSRTAQVLFADGVAPGPIDDDHRVHDWIVRTYYVSQDSVDRPGLPALRVKTLTRVGGNPTFVDTEVMPGVEDMQVQFGIDSGDYNNDGIVDAAVDQNGDGIPESDGRATRYVNADFPGLATLQVVSIRLWLRVRGAEVEPGFIDDRRYQYADVDYTPSGAERLFRRVLVSRTIALRNARTL
ncbi:MAG: PilW family protein [Steroidobacteraceae bacterium]|nr:PilW family protein [Steroidobacteraceae bacterium]MDW8259553.1 PilW family protein [Gammaproteobacteria bacterium]